MWLAISLPVLVFLLWIGIHRIPWLGPLVADTLRAVIGVDNVTKLEDFAYGIEDRVNRFTKGDDKPKAYWEVPETPAVAVVDAGASTAEAGPPPLPVFQPPEPGPVHESWSAPGDGKWVPMPDFRDPDVDPRLHKTLLHPDRNRSWAELFVVAVDLRRVDLQIVAGRYEPRNKSRKVEYERHAVIPKKHYDVVLGAFNGGFKYEHGRWGMMVDGHVLVKPRGLACGIAKYKSGKYRVEAWKILEEGADDMSWWRQTPGCMFERGEMHVGLRAENNTAWGATLDGDTVIRRSAIGLSEDRKILYVGISNHTTARAIAEGMHHAGAHDVAQLDVNWSYPKFVTFAPGEGGSDLVAVALAEGFEFHEDEYLRRRSHRDFFYLAKKVPDPTD